MFFNLVVRKKDKNHMTRFGKFVVKCCNLTTTWVLALVTLSLYENGWRVSCWFTIQSTVTLKWIKINTICVLLFVHFLTTKGKDNLCLTFYMFLKVHRFISFSSKSYITRYLIARSCTYSRGWLHIDCQQLFSDQDQKHYMWPRSWHKVVPLLNFNKLYPLVSAT